MKFLTYNRKNAVSYARTWALGRNPAYYNFNDLGGDCTSFVSQCIYAGTGIMNYIPETGWFYRNANDRTASWTGVDYLFDFLTQNRSVGPFGYVCGIEDVQLGDVIQLGDSSYNFYHSLLVVNPYPQIRVCAHSQDALNRLLSSYVFENMRCIHIEGARVW